MESLKAVHTCQSCGMPIRKPDLFGTDREGIPIVDYCVYCYKDGSFTEEVTMDEMIRLCSRYVEGNSKDVAIVGMKMQYPRLKRWARKEQTQNEHYKSVIRVMEYIQGHLGENTDLKTLATIANISPYHFHRIFKLTIGESMAEYVLRLRMEYVAEQLKNTLFSLGELAEKTGYSSEQALSRAFKRYFSLPPTTFRDSFLKEKFNNELIPRVCKVMDKPVITLKDAPSGEKAWQKLYTYAMFKKLLTEDSESVEIRENNQPLPCLTTREPATADHFIRTIVLPEGLYAIFTHKGSYEKLDELYHAITRHWLSYSKYKLTPGAIPYFIYVNHPSFIAPSELITEIYFPVVKK